MSSITITILSLLAISIATERAVGSAVPNLTLSWNPGASVVIPRVLLGTGGGGGGYDVSAWLSVGGMGMDSAVTYCYNTAAPFCSHTAIYNAIAGQHRVNATDLFLISKIEPEDFGVVSVMSGFGRVLDRGILQDMSITRIDMLMAHQAGRHEKDTNVRPECFDPTLANTSGTYSTCRTLMMQSFIALQAAGLARSFAVSNWQIRDLQQVFSSTGFYPSALEVEVHPYWHEDALLSFCMANNITVINYAPLALASMALFAEPAVVAAASAHGVTPAQAILRWGLQKTGGVVIPRSANVSHMVDNQDVFGFALTAAEMSSMDGYPQKKIFSVYCQPWC